MDRMAAVETQKRLRILVSGVVQGVGFRPFVYRLAKEAELDGFIRNTSSGVCIEIQGKDPAKLSSFQVALRENAPPLARISSVEAAEIPPLERGDFSILDSEKDGAVQTMVSPDFCICEDCKRELLDSADRRYGYPFINCTNCGPRYTIIERIPYDRPGTSMKHFRMCGDCQAEYDEPMNRRFHAQPNACSECGPALAFLDCSGKKVDCGEPLEHALDMIRQGMIVAVKGIGGFHLAVDALDDRAVFRLRKKKKRDEKPFALMARDMMTIERYCHINEDEKSALLSPEAPIVLLEKRGEMLPVSIAPGNDRLGFMLPYSPLHVLMMEKGPEVLVMTSANRSDEPVIIDDDEAVACLGGIADGYLMHNRPIYLRCDDSVTMHMHGKLRQIRRARGYAPAPVPLASGGPQVMSVGAEIKNTVCILKEKEAILSQHIGDLKNYEAYSHFLKVGSHLRHIFQVFPELLVCDMHPSYLSVRWAQEQKESVLLQVQHHHAHMASCMAENRFEEPCIGVLLDGTGFGTDGTVWGGEILIGNLSEAFRFAWFEPVPLPGGDAAVQEPWKVAAGYLYHCFGNIPDIPFLRDKAPAGITQILEKGINSPFTSSCGRLFDAVAGMTDLRAAVSYEGQAAIELMHAAGSLEGRPYSRDLIPAGNDRWMLAVSPLVQDVVDDLLSGVDAASISRNVHVTLVEMLVDIVGKASDFSGLRNVVLSGGVFQNNLLFEGLASRLEDKAFTVLSHERVPCNDGGICLGQAVIGREYLKGTYKGVT